MSPSRAYILFSAALGLMFMVTTATYVPFLTSIGLTLSQVSMVNGWFWVAIILFEVPTGMWADARSRAWSLRIGFLIFALGNAIYFLAENVWWALAAEVVNGLAFTFLSGIQQAWIVDALKLHNRENEKGQTFANAAIVKGLLAAPAAIFGSWIGSTFGLRWPWIASAFFALVGLFVVTRYMNGDGEVLAHEKVSEKEALKRSVNALRNSSALRWAVAVGMVSGLVVAFNHYWPKYFEQFVATSQLGLIWSPLYLALFIAGMIIRKAKIASGAEAKAVMIALVVAGVGLALIGQVPGLGLVLVMGVVHEVGRGAFRPLLDSYTNHHVTSEYRSTFGSLQSLMEEIGAAIVLFSLAFYMSGREDTPANIADVWLASGGLLVILAIVLYFLRPKERP